MLGDQAQTANSLHARKVYNILMPFPKSLTTVTPFSKLLALSMFIIIPILAFFYGIYYEQMHHTELPFMCKQWQTVCKPNSTDPNGGCTPKKLCVDSASAIDQNRYSCPKTKQVNCMPIVSKENQKYCDESYIKWAEKYCPNFEVVY